MRPGPWLAAVLLATGIGACGNAPPAAEAVLEVDSLLGPGQEHYWRADYDSARIVWGAALDRAEAAGDSLGRAHLLTWLGLSAMRIGDYETSRSEGEAALELKLALGEKQELARSYNALGLLADYEDRPFDAIRLYEHTRVSAQEVGDELMNAKAAANLGLIHAYLGDLERAGLLLRQARDAAVALGESRLEANAMNNLAMVAIWSGDPQAALAPLDSALRLYDDLESPFGAQHALGQLATAYSAMGRYQKAITALDSALTLARRHGLSDQEAENRRLIGSLLADLGDDRRALRQYQEAAGIARELGLDAELGNISRHAAISHLALGSQDQALTHAEEALAAHRAASEPFEELDDLLVLAEIQQRMDDHGAALSSLRSARLIAQQLDARSARTSVALADGRHAEVAGEPRRVLRAVAEARGVGLEADYRSRMESHGLAARAYAVLGELDSAAVEGLAAVEALDRVRDDLASGDLRGSFAATSARLYGDVVLILLQSGRTEEAFAVADEARSRALLHRLTAVRPDATAGDSISDPAVGSSGLGEAELLLRRIDALLSQLRYMEGIPPEERGSSVAATSGEILSRITGLRDEYESLLIHNARADLRSAGMLGSLRADRTLVQSTLQPNEALLHYTLTRDQLVIFIARTDRFETVRVPVAAEDLASRIRLLRALWGVRGGTIGRGLPAAQGLHELLVAPVAGTGLLNGAARLLIVPHGVLEQLPFAALHDRDSGRYLVEDYIVASVPSASALAALRSEGEFGQQPLEGRLVSAFAPFPAELPGTRSEAAAACGACTKGRLFLDQNANEGALRTALTTGVVVHVASHGILNARNPMFSRIDLARGPGSGSADDGRLEVHEVLELKVKSPLVVLSGCETALAEEWSGDPLRPAGITSLAQAFLQAGASNVLATIWRIDDIGSAELVSRFYEQSRHGDVARALAGAQRSMIEHAEFAPPYYWAGFALAGSGPAGFSAQSKAPLSVP